ncbi:ricin-type beta-trefoil lectin domain protein [Streptomyces sp. ID01-12c]|uniref:ricin-type beta-trefoil lectin domain protein n=1 Tax=Streptomyces caniscabiei TaxID=2746961 RepID=UPI0017856FEF|nr:RICIN domain-containing protein [Streptomyces caniscabiei]MBD9703660.1 ricin-type beta-trefoil lectin domain protein [Streptomyces caniscabiei]MDX3733711.1 RICIN domain-containing protein [Streptomyces caniscabiei]
MSLWTSLEPASATVDPGSSTTVRLRLRNTGDVVDEYRFEPVGDVAPWTTVEPQTLRLYPGTTGTVELTFAPPRTPDATAGPHPYAVRITPTQHPEATTVPEGNLTITPFTEVRAELVPPTVKGRLRGRPQLAIDNLGNTKVTASVGGSDNGDQLSYDIHPSNVQIEPGRAAFVKATLKPRQIIWFGSKEERPYALAVQRAGVAPQSVDGTYVQRGFLPGWLATCLGVAVALAITFVTLWFAYQPRVVSAASDLQQAGTTALPSASPSAMAPAPTISAAPLPSETPEAVPQEEEPEEDPGSGSGSGGGSGAGSGSGSGGSGSGADPEPDTKETPKKKPSAVKGFAIIGQGSNRCVDVTDAQNGKGKDGTPLQIWDCAGSANQRWDFRGDGTVRSLGLCMDVAWGSRDDGAVIQLARCSGNPAQQFVLSTEGDLVNPQADKCVDVKDNATRNGADLQLWTCAGTPNQKWRVK